MILFYDTETTGLPDYRSSSDAEHQPHIVQFAAILVDPETKIERTSIDLIVKPEGWAIPDKVAKIHGITTEIAEACGVPELTVANLFLARGSLNSCLIEFVSDGWRCVTSRNALRRA